MRTNEKVLEFNVDAYTARLIGRENVSKLEGAVLEIVKNAYDADAKVFCLYYTNSQDCIYIMDNGSGMEEQVIVDHWMTIGNSSKKETYMSRGNRIQTGAKGIGRFALDRISDRCTILTVSEKGALEWVVDWGDFEGRKNISDVKATLYRSDDGLLKFADLENWQNCPMAEAVRQFDMYGTGTVFRLEGLHDVWDDKTFKRLKMHLENLLPPDVVHDFRIFFFDDRTPAEEAEIVSANVENYDYKIAFQVEEERLNIQITRNEFDFGSDEERICKEAGFDEKERQYFHGKEKRLEFDFSELGENENLIGNISGTIYFNKIAATNQKADAKFYYKDMTGRKNLTKDFGGIKLYRDHFRVRPYGEYGDNDFDWLELAPRRSRSPAGLGHPTGSWRVGAEQLVGIIDISRKNRNLEDAANRNGIQEGPGFTQLKRILLRVIAEFERDRQGVGRKLAAYAKKQDKIEAERQRMADLAEQRRRWEEEDESRRQADKENAEDSRRSGAVPSVNPLEVEKLLEAMDEKQEQELQELRDENKMMQTLATTGIITNMFMHEIRTLTNNIGQELDAAYEAIKYDGSIEEAFRNITQAITFKKHFASWFGVTIESIKKDKRQRRKNNIKTMLQEFIETWRNILERSHVELHYSCEEDIEFKCFEFDIENIISNLISNSLASFDREEESVLETKEITLTITREENGFVIHYADTGWGLVEKYKTHPERILEAFETSRATADEEEEGTGMGMWIVNRTVSEYHGSLSLEANKRLARGFQITIGLGGKYV